MRNNQLKSVVEQTPEIFSAKGMNVEKILI
jgi:hypothetical protein